VFSRRRHFGRDAAGNTDGFQPRAIYAIEGCRRRFSLVRYKRLRGAGVAGSIVPPPTCMVASNLLANRCRIHRHAHGKRSDYATHIWSARTHGATVCGNLKFTLLVLSSKLSISAVGSLCTAIEFSPQQPHFFQF